MVTLRTFITDEHYDREYASNRASRYGAYLALNANMFVEDNKSTTDPARFALTAWEIANSPIMAPGYVRANPRVLDTVAHRDSDRRPALTITLVAPLPDAVASVANRRLWRGWKQEGHSDPYWHEPYDNDRPAAFATVAVRVPLRITDLPTPRYHERGPDTHTAKDAVRALCHLLNGELDPILAALNTGTTPR